MNEDTTRHLSHVLENVCGQEETEEFVGKNSAELPAFHEYLAAVMREKEIKTADVVKRSRISKNYVYNILNGDKTNPGRDKVIALCVASEMTYKETQRALEISGLAPLYPRDERDVRIATAINRGVNDVMNINLMLDEHGLQALDV